MRGHTREQLRPDVLADCPISFSADHATLGSVPASPRSLPRATILNARKVERSPEGAIRCPDPSVEKERTTRMHCPADRKLQLSVGL